MKRLLFTFVMATIVLASGCGKNENIIKSHVTVPEYSKNVYDAVDVTIGDLTPEITLKLKADKYRLVKYYPLYDEMEVEKVYVTKGEHVKKGQRLISYKSGDINDRISEYQDQLDEHMLMLEHYNKLKDMADKNSREMTDKKEKENYIFKRDQFDVDIQMINESIALDNLYIQELQAQLSSYSVYAEDSGIVYDLTEGLESTKVNTDKSIVAVTYGNDSFIYLSNETEELDLEIGQIYKGIDGKDEYDIQLAHIENDIDDNGNALKKYIFEAPNNSDFSYADEMTLTLKMPTLKNVIYIPTKCIQDLNDQLFVYLLDENGYRSVAYITVGEKIDDQTVILSGLKEGDRVVIQ